MQKRQTESGSPKNACVHERPTAKPTTERRPQGRFWGSTATAILTFCVCVTVIFSFYLFGAPFGIDVGQSSSRAGYRCPTAATTAPPQDAAALKVAAMMAPIMALPLRCNPRNMRPLTPRPCNYDASTAEVVVGILSLDNKGHAELRQVQRDSWFWYGDVAKPSNGFSGRMFVEYVFGAAFENDFKFSKALYRESREHANILVMDVKERKRVVKKLLTSGRYGAAAEFTMTVKSLAYYCYAEQTYARARFIVKTDDDVFIRVPVVMRTIEALPSYGVVWAPFFGGGGFCGTSGIWIGLSRDTVHLINSLRVVQDYGALRMTEKGVRLPNGTVTAYEWLQSNTPHTAEDIMPFLAVNEATVRTSLTRELGLQYTMSFYAENRCRVHNVERDKLISWLRYFANPFSMIVHHANAEEQQHYRRVYPDDGGYNITFQPSTKQTCFNGPFMVADMCSHSNAKIHL